jgi:hypothetical protein
MSADAGPCDVCGHALGLHSEGLRCGRCGVDCGVDDRHELWGPLRPKRWAYDVSRVR